jgi:enamine deaminase RidA (YjgF/YER057c/UK114 family)
MSPGKVFAVPPARPGPERRLADLGLELPALRPTAGMYQGWAPAGDLLFLSGQGADGWTGRLGTDLDLEQGRLAARDCALNLLAQTRDALGSLDRVARVVKLTGFVACVPEFSGVPAVVDGASAVLLDVFGDRGRHARSAVGVAALPLGFAVEVEMVVSVASAGTLPGRLRAAVPAAATATPWSAPPSGRPRPAARP